LALPALLLSLDISVLLLALPQLSADLGAGNIEQLWITDIYGFMIAGFLVTMGTLGDKIGRRRLLLIGAAAFGIASVLAAFSTSPEMLIATRTVLGIAGATVLPSTLALVSNMFRDPGQNGFAITTVFSCFLSREPSVPRSVGPGWSMSTGCSCSRWSSAAARDCSSPPT
jgi:MFS transporter, DHA2 family, multidrug resistance protein